MKPSMLFVSPEFPCPASSGGRLRTISLLHCLARHFEIHCVTFAEIQPSKKDKECLRSLVAELTILPLRFHRRTKLRRYVRNIGRMLRCVPPLVDRFSESGNRQVLAGMLANKTDYVWLEHLWLAPYVADIHRAAIKILDAHNVESDFYRQLRQASCHPLDHLGYHVFEKAARRIERRYLPCFDRILAVSEEDRGLLARDCPTEKTFLVPNAVKLSPVPTTEDHNGCNLYFAGRLDYPPNREAVLWFYNQIWPVIQRRVPEARWSIVGACPELLGENLQRDTHILLLGEVGKTDHYLHPSSLVIVPVSAGGGTRFKILDAWAAGKAVVSTTKGAEGLAARHGDNIWIADNPLEFAEGVIRLLADPNLRRALGTGGWETVREQYSWERLQERLDAALFGVKMARA